MQSDLQKIKNARKKTCKIAILAINSRIFRQTASNGGFYSGDATYFAKK
jgi:hypothetical protein